MKRCQVLVNRMGVMSGSIYLLQGDNKRLLELTETSYAAEDLLQELIANYPKLLAGDQMDSDAPRRWLLVRREMPVPGEEGGSDRWSLDHLFLDQEGIPTLIEVKRSSDTRLRREVVGQMLDYAANAVVYWPLERIQLEFEQGCKAQGFETEEVLLEFLGTGDADAFWQDVKTNLQAGRVRMVFVADVIPLELRRVVEFLNTQMNPAEVLALEVKQYVGEGVQTLVPRVVGQTAAAQQRRSVRQRQGKQWDEVSFFQALRDQNLDEEAKVARRLLTWARERGLRIDGGRGEKLGSLFPLYDDEQGHHFTFAIWTDGRVELQFQHMQKRAPFGDEAKRKALLDLINELPGLSIPEDKIRGRPNIPLSVLEEEVVLEQFLKIFDGYLADIKDKEAKG